MFKFNVKNRFKRFTPIDDDKDKQELTWITFVIALIVGMCVL